MKDQQTSVSDVALAWAWDQVRERQYPAAAGVILVYLAGKARRDGELWTTWASHSELEEISGSRLKTVTGVLGRLRADGLMERANRSWGVSRRAKLMRLAVVERTEDGEATP